MFADDTNLFFSDDDINTLFTTVNSKQQKISEWFISNKPSCNVKKTKYLFIHKSGKQDNIPLD